MAFGGGLKARLLAGLLLGTALISTTPSLGQAVVTEPASLGAFKRLCIDTDADRSLSLQAAATDGWATLPPDFLGDLGIDDLETRTGSSGDFLLVGETSIEGPNTVCSIFARGIRLEQVTVALATWLGDPGADRDPRPDVYGLAYSLVDGQPQAIATSTPVAEQDRLYMSQQVRLHAGATRRSARRNPLISRHCC